MEDLGSYLADPTIVAILVGSHTLCLRAKLMDKALVEVEGGLVAAAVGDMVSVEEEEYVIGFLVVVAAVVAEAVEDLEYSVVADHP